MSEKREIIHANTLSVDTKKSMKSRILIGLILALTIPPFIFIGDYAFLALMLVVAGIAAYEIIRVPQSVDKKFSIWVHIVTYAAIFIPFIATFVINNSIIDKTPFYDYTTGFSDITSGLIAFIGVILFYFIISFFDEKFTIADVFYFIVMDGILFLGIISFLQLRYIPLLEITMEGTDIYSSLIPLTDRFVWTTGLIFYLIIAVCGNDIMAYFTGVLFGKHKMLPRISPKKTWEGFAGGVIGSMILSAGFAFLMSYFGHPIIRFFDLEHWYLIIGFSILLPIVGTIGDLIFSAIKRQYAIKDFGTILKSHGGALDRLDSILISSCALAISVNMLIKLFEII